MFSIIIVDYNTIEKTLKYIQSIKQAVSNNQLVNYVVIQNGDANKSSTYLNTHCVYINEIYKDENGRTIERYNSDDIEFIYCNANENLGYAKGNNLGAKIAKKLFNDEFIVISNNDLIFEEQLDLIAIKQLFDSRPDISIVGPKVVGLKNDAQTPHKKMSALIRLILWQYLMTLGIKKFRNKLDDIIRTESDTECDWVTGCFFYVRSDDFFECGGFDENTFLYYEEPILSARIKGKTYFYINQKVIHNHSQTIKKNLSNVKNNKYCFDSGFYYYKTYTNTSKIVLHLSKATFYICSFLSRIKYTIMKAAKNLYEEHFKNKHN